MWCCVGVLGCWGLSVVLCWGVVVLGFECGVGVLCCGVGVLGFECGVGVLVLECWGVGV